MPDSRLVIGLVSCVRTWSVHLVEKFVFCRAANIWLTSFPVPGEWLNQIPGFPEKRIIRMFWRNKILLFIYKLNAVLAILSIAGFNILYLILQASGISGYEFNILKHEIGGLFPLSLLFILLAFIMLPAIWLLKIRLSLLFKLLPVFALVYWIVVFLLDPGGVFYWYAGD